MMTVRIKQSISDQLYTLLNDERLHMIICRMSQFASSLFNVLVISSTYYTHEILLVRRVYLLFPIFLLKSSCAFTFASSKAYQCYTINPTKLISYRIKLVRNSQLH
jgi:hypothetical protein